MSQGTLLPHLTCVFIALREETPDGSQSRTYSSLSDTRDFWVMKSSMSSRAAAAAGQMISVESLHSVQVSPAEVNLPLATPRLSDKAEHHRVWYLPSHGSVLHIKISVGLTEPDALRSLVDGQETEVV